MFTDVLDYMLLQLVETASLELTNLFAITHYFRERAGQFNVQDGHLTFVSFLGFASPLFQGIENVMLSRGNITKHSFAHGTFIRNSNKINNRPTIMVLAT